MFPGKDLNALRMQEVGDPEIATRIAGYEMAYRMQSSAPELMDLFGETKQTLAMSNRNGASAGIA